MLTTRPSLPSEPVILMLDSFVECRESLQYRLLQGDPKEADTGVPPERILEVFRQVADACQVLKVKVFDRVAES